MRLFIILTLNLLLFSCGKDIDLKDGLVIKRVPKDPRKILTTNPEFNQFIDLFIDDHIRETGNSINVGNIPINFRSTIGHGENTIGVCFIYKNGGKRWKEIIINKDWWENSADDYRKEVLIKHELGHCALNRDHVDDSHNGERVSIMHSYLLSSDAFKTHRHGYNVELYTKDQSIIKLSIEQ